MHSSLSHSSVIMPTPNRESSPAVQVQDNDTASQAGTIAQSSVPTTPSLSMNGGEDEDDVISLHSSDESEFDDVVQTHLTTGTSTQAGSVADEDEFDFVDESENENEV